MLISTQKVDDTLVTKVAESAKKYEKESGHKTAADILFDARDKQNSKADLKRARP